MKASIYDQTRLWMALSILALILITAGLIGWSGMLRAAEPFVVDSLSDTGDGNCENNALGKCTLRAAIQQANDTAGADVIVFSDTELIYPATIELSDVLTITDGLTIIGPGMESLTVDSNDAHRHFILDSPDAPVTISESCSGQWFRFLRRFDRARSGIRFCGNSLP